MRRALLAVVDFVVGDDLRIAVGVVLRPFWTLVFQASFVEQESNLRPTH